MIPMPLMLGLLAGGTVFLGFPVARLRRLPVKTQALLNAISTGILIFLLVEITGHILEGTEELLQRVVAGQPGVGDLVRQLVLFTAGFSAGLLGLVLFERRFLDNSHDLPTSRRSRQVATMIALGLGLHNFSEGLAIGQGYAAGAFSLAWLLAIGFALHNATEGFGIAAPLSGQRASWRFLVGLALLAGGPTCLGAVLGGWWTNKAVEVFCLALAAGTMLYVVGELLHLGRRLKEESVVAVGLLIGFFVAVATDFTLVAAMHQPSSAPLQAQSADSPQQEHRPRHGGIFGDADDLYHYEVLMDRQRQLVLYVNDELNRPMDVRGLQARWTLNPDHAPVTGTFHPADSGAYLLAAMPDTADEQLHVEVAVLKGRQWVPMEFFVPAPQQTAEAPAGPPGDSARAVF